MGQDVEDITAFFILTRVSYCSGLDCDKECSK